MNGTLIKRGLPVTIGMENFGDGYQWYGFSVVDKEVRPIAALNVAVIEADRRLLARGGEEWFSGLDETDLRIHQGQELYVMWEEEWVPPI